VPKLQWSLLNVDKKLYIYLNDFLAETNKCILNFFPAIELTNIQIEKGITHLQFHCISKPILFRNEPPSAVIPVQTESAKFNIIDLINIMGKQGFLNVSSKPLILKK